MIQMVNGIPISYEDRGTGIPLLLIHGYPLSRKLWEPQMASLADIARVIVPDLRGHGESLPAASTRSEYIPYTMELFADDCAGLLQALRIEQPIVVGGLSMGGYIALAFTRKYPQRVAGLILAATRAGSDSPEGKANREKAAALAKASGASAIADSMLPKMLSPKTFTTKPDLAASVLDMMRATSVSGIVGALLGMKDRPDSTSFLPHMQMPALLLHGEDDQIIPLTDMQLMAEALPNAQLRVIPDAGHLLNMEQPDSFNREVRDFLTKLKGDKA